MLLGFGLLRDNQESVRKKFRSGTTRELYSDMRFWRLFGLKIQTEISAARFSRRIWPTHPFVFWFRIRLSNNWLKTWVDSFYYQNAIHLHTEVSNICFYSWDG